MRHLLLAYDLSNGLFALSSHSTEDGIRVHAKDVVLGDDGHDGLDVRTLWLH